MLHVLLVLAIWDLLEVHCQDDIDEYCLLRCPQRENAINTICMYKCLVGKECLDEELIELRRQHRELIVDLHNKYRERIASGNEFIGGNGPATNMNAVSYDQELELSAKCWARQCRAEHDICRRTKRFPLVGQNLYVRAAYKNESDEKYIINALADFYSQVTFCSTMLILNFHDTSSLGRQTSHFTQLVWANTTHVGCSLMKYHRKNVNLGINVPVVQITCNYGPAGNVINEPVYVFGEPASECEHGRLNERYPSLCGEIEEIANGSIRLPEPETQSQGEATEITELTLLFLFLLLSGLVQVFGRASANGVSKLWKLDYEKKRTFALLCFRTWRIPFSQVGQNFHKRKANSNYTREKTLTRFIGHFYHQIKHCSISLIQSYFDKGKNKNPEQFTQLVWASTTHVGCSLIKYKKQRGNKTSSLSQIVCNYGPSGNIIGEPVYVPGRPASQCDGEREPSERYPSLCQETGEYDDDYDEFSNKRNNGANKLNGLTFAISIFTFMYFSRIQTFY